MRELDSYELALLRGGAKGVLHAALAALVESGALSVDDGGLVKVRVADGEPGARAAHPVERAVLRAASAQVTATSLLSDPGFVAEVEQLQRYLVADGYLTGVPVTLGAKLAVGLRRLQRKPRYRTRAGDSRLRYERGRQEALRTSAEAGYVGNPGDAALTMALFGSEMAAGRRSRWADTRGCGAGSWFAANDYGLGWGCGTGNHRSGTGCGSVISGCGGGCGGGHGGDGGGCGGGGCGGGGGGGCGGGGCGGGGCGS